jgi:hypothetical protein
MKIKTLLILFLFTFQVEAQTIRSIAGVTSSRNSASAPVGDAPVISVTPVISDVTPKVGEEITVTNGTWTNSPTSFSYQWSRDGLSITGATANAYTPTSADYNLPLTCTVTATNASGSGQSTTSATSNVLPANPVNTSIGNITGIYQSGQTLTCSQGTWTGQGTITYAYQWTRDGANIGGATSSTYLATVSDEDKTVACKITATNAGGSTTVITDGVVITDPSLSRMVGNIVVNSTTGEKGIVYEPPAYGNNSDNYPLLVVYSGSGERGIHSEGNTLCGTGNGSQTVFSGSITLTDTNHRILHSSVYIQVNGVTVATGRRGVITGSGVSGTYGTDTGSPTYSITFTAAPTTGYQVRIYYIQSNLLKQQYGRFLNLGDEPNLLVLLMQTSDEFPAGYVLDRHWDVPIQSLIDAGYRIDTNRLYCTGFSLGGVMGIQLLGAIDDATITYKCAAFVEVAPGAVQSVPPAGDAAWGLASNMGKLMLRGSSDTNGTTQISSAMANGDHANAEFPIIASNYWGIGHSNFPDTYVYSRKNRTDVTGSAYFDFIDEFLMLFSLDLEEQADLWTSYAETTLKTEHYRIAKRQTDNLTAGAVKTALLGRLTTLKSSLGKTVLIDIGPDFYSSTGNYNKIISAAAGTNARRASTTSTDLIDDEGNATGFGCTIVAATAAAPAVTNSTARLSGRQWGAVPNFTYGGMLVDAAGTTGTLKFTGLNNAKTYKLKLYGGASSTAWSSRAEVEVVAGGVTKYAYWDMNTFRMDDDSPANGYVEYVSLTPSGGEISFTLKTRLTASTERDSYLLALELIENP